jgi:hypothetical protein
MLLAIVNSISISQNPDVYDVWLQAKCIQTCST